MKINLYFLLIVWLAIACQSSDNASADASPKNEAIGCGPTLTNDKAWYASGKKAPLFDGLEGIHFTITTASPEAQRYFNQGMMLSYGFNHAEAARSFYEVTKLDTNCAMGWWGFAYVLGPNYNGGMEDDNYERAFTAVQKAKALSANASAKEKALIEAIGHRYAATPPAERGELDIAYANAMKEVYAQFPNDADVGALYAESIMDLHPWDLYEKGSKQPRPWTPSILAVLEHLIQLHPQHPGAHHFFIHALEASSAPEKAIPSAQLLDSLVTGSGHLVHMPSHIYINTGDYHLGTLANIYASEVDSIYTTTCHAQGAYPLAYYPHNIHFLVATAALEGNSTLAWQAAKSLQQHTAKDIMTEAGWGTLQHYYTIPWYTAVKLAMWDTLLAVPEPKPSLIYPRAIWRYGRGMALLGKKDLAAAKKELAALKLLAADSSLQQLTIWDINTTADLVQIANHVLSAGVAIKEGDMKTAATLLQEAVALEDALNYNEPPDWFFSVRHHLGAVLLKQKKYEEAEKVYRDDLKIWKKNGWALSGLQQALEGLQKHEEAKTAKADFDKAWQYADFRLKTSSPIAD